MAVAAGGLIKQTIVRDYTAADGWADIPPLAFNVQIVNSAVFKAITGKSAPPTPVSPAVYAEAGLPFFKLYEEPSGIQGDFSAVKSVAQLKKEKGIVDEAEKIQEYPLIMLNSDSTQRFRPVANLERELRKVTIADF